ncbi:MAG TPA: RtcB family protein [Acidimicrobiia bacterium]|nr:RtcB family protein [Acidimicrobiia bacterium]
MSFQRTADALWEAPATDGMRVPGRVFASEDLFRGAAEDKALEQVVDVAHLPGIVEASFAMPDIHWGYGFPIGGVAATDVDAGGVVSPGGVGFDICCGVRLIGSGLDHEDIRPRLEAVMARLDDAIPRGLGKGAVASKRLLEDVLAVGAPAAVEAGFGTSEDLDRCEERGSSEGADPAMLSDRAVERGSQQLGSLGGGNHFLEVQWVDRIEDREAAEAFGLAEGMVCVMIHCGSRGLGHQTCTDHVKSMGPAMKRHGIQVPDRQLASVPVQSDEGRRYLGAMAASANFAWANRHILADATRKAFAGGLGTEVAMPLIYDVAHNLAKIERHEVDGRERTLCVHRKGATRAQGPGHPSLPDDLSPVGQPVLIPGSMGTSSWILAGVSGNPAFDSAAHGAGRVMSRTQAKKRQSGRSVMAELESEDIAVRPGSVNLLAEEAPYAYKDVDEVVRVCKVAGLARPVARLRPMGVVKG